MLKKDSNTRMQGSNAENNAWKQSQHNEYRKHEKCIGEMPDVSYFSSPLIPTVETASASCLCFPGVCLQKYLVTWSQS